MDLLLVPVQELNFRQIAGTRLPEIIYNKLIPGNSEVLEGRIRFKMPHGNIFATPSRSVQHGTMTRKNFEKHFGHTYSKERFHHKDKHNVDPQGHKSLRLVAKSHEQVVGQPPKNWEKPDIPDECRFIIPDVPENKDIFMSSYLRTRSLLGEVVQELQTKMKLNDADTEHDIQLLSS
jgi:hypothetical protein